MDAMYLPHGDPNEAVYFDLDAKRVTLASGKLVPILAFRDMDGETVDECELDLHDDLAIVCGPAANGMLVLCTISTRNGWRDGKPSPAVGTPVQREPSYRNH